MIEKLALTIPGGYTFEPAVEGLPDGDFSTLQSIITWSTTMLMIIAVLVATFLLIWGGIQWIMSSGSKEKIEGARKKIIFAVIGLILIFSSFLILSIVGGVFGIEFFEPNSH